MIRSPRLRSDRSSGVSWAMKSSKEDRPRATSWKEMPLSPVKGTSSGKRSNTLCFKERVAVGTS